MPSVGTVFAIKILLEKTEQMAEQANTKLLEGIAYFEKMLKVMPGDRTTLEFLSVAYEQLGDAEKQRTALIQLAEALLREKDYDAAEAIGERLGGFPRRMPRTWRVESSPYGTPFS